MVNPAFFDSKQGTGVLVVLLKLLGTHRRQPRKKFKDTFTVIVKRWSEVGGKIWEDFLEEVNFNKKTKLLGKLSGKA